MKGPYQKNQASRTLKKDRVRGKTPRRVKANNATKIGGKSPR